MAWARTAMLVLASLLLFGAAESAPAPPAPLSNDIVIFGDIDRGDYQTYVEVPFEVPRGTTRITVRFDYDHANNTVIDLGLLDQNGFRGWSGGNKMTFNLGLATATASYLPGPIKPGKWRLLLGVPNIREGVTAKFRAVISFETGGSERAVRPAPYPTPVLNPAAGWYRGDLHMHTANSDGVCAGADGTRGPCPLVRTLSAAKAAGLDFIAITDHNTTSQFAEMAALQGEWTSLLLIPGREITTFRGHANVLGPTAFIDFRRPIEEVIRETHRLGGLFVINHPGLPSGESCMGCGWTWPMSGAPGLSADAVEVVNGGAWGMGGIPDGPFSGWDWWARNLGKGGGAVVVGGSDNHDASLPASMAPAVGRPTTVVWAKNLSAKEILAGIRSGRVFIDMTLGAGHVLDLREARTGAVMGGTVEIRRLGSQAPQFSATIAGVAKGRLEVITSAGPRRGQIAFEGDASVPFEISAEEASALAWVRVQVRDEGGAILMMSNPIFLTTRFGDR